MSGDTSVFATLGLWMIPTALCALVIGIWHSRRFDRQEREAQERRQREITLYQWEKTKLEQRRVNKEQRSQTRDQQ